MTRHEIITAMLIELKARGLFKMKKEIAEKIGVNSATLSSALHDNNNCLTESLLLKLNEAYGNIFSISWIITGEGEMLAKKPEEQTFNVNMGSGMQVGDGNTYNESADAAQLDALRKENTELKEEVTILRKEVAEKDKTIARLEGRIETYKEMIGK